MGGKSKGGTFERKLCVDLSEWWSGGERDDIFWRTSGSGSRGTARSKRGKSTHGQYGDIQAVDPLGAPLMALFTIEAKKGYNKETLSHLLDRKPDSKPTELEGFIRQAIEDCTKAGTPYWLLIHKRDNRETLVVLPHETMNSFPKLRRVRPGLLLGLAGLGKLFVCPWESFKAAVRPKMIRFQARQRSLPRLIVEHHCHARGCKVQVPPELLMCKRHWFMVSAATRKAVWKHYRKGQCDDKSPSREWLRAATRAIREVWEKDRPRRMKVVRKESE